MKLQITVTKEILKASERCGFDDKLEYWVHKECAIALAVRDIFPDAHVLDKEISVFNDYDHPNDKVIIPIPIEAQNFIKEFDKLKIAPYKRLELPELTFEVEVPDSVIEKIDISGIYENHPTLKLITA